MASYNLKILHNSVILDSYEDVIETLNNYGYHSVGQPIAILYYTSEEHVPENVKVALAIGKKSSTETGANPEDYYEIIGASSGGGGVGVHICKYYDKQSEDDDADKGAVHWAASDESQVGQLVIVTNDDVISTSELWSSNDKGLYVVRVDKSLIKADNHYIYGETHPGTDITTKTVGGIKAGTKLADLMATTQGGDFSRILDKMLFEPTTPNIELTLLNTDPNISDPHKNFEIVIDPDSTSVSYGLYISTNPDLMDWCGIQNEKEINIVGHEGEYVRMIKQDLPGLDFVYGSDSLEFNTIYYVVAYASTASGCGKIYKTIRTNDYIYSSTTINSHTISADSSHSDVRGSVNLTNTINDYEVTDINTGVLWSTYEITSPIDLPSWTNKVEKPISDYSGTSKGLTFDYTINISGLTLGIKYYVYSFVVDTIDKTHVSLSEPIEIEKDLGDIIISNVEGVISGATTSITNVTYSGTISYGDYQTNKTLNIGLFDGDGNGITSKTITNLLDGDFSGSFDDISTLITNNKIKYDVNYHYYVVAEGQEVSGDAQTKEYTSNSFSIASILHDEQITLKNNDRIIKFDYDIVSNTYTISDIRIDLYEGDKSGDLIAQNVRSTLTGTNIQVEILPSKSIKYNTHYIAALKFKATKIYTDESVIIELWSNEIVTPVGDEFEGIVTGFGLVPSSVSGKLKVDNSITWQVTEAGPYHNFVQGAPTYFDITGATVANDNLLYDETYRAVIGVTGEKNDSSGVLYKEFDSTTSQVSVSPSLTFLEMAGLDVQTTAQTADDPITLIAISGDTQTTTVKYSLALSNNNSPCRSEFFSNGVSIKTKNEPISNIETETITDIPVNVTVPIKITLTDILYSKQVFSTRYIKYIWVPPTTGEQICSATMMASCDYNVDQIFGYGKDSPCYGGDNEVTILNRDTDDASIETIIYLGETYYRAAISTVTQANYKSILYVSVSNNQSVRFFQDSLEHDAPGKEYTGSEISTKLFNYPGPTSGPKNLYILNYKFPTDSDAYYWIKIE